jgi:hypothetical protein
MTQTLHGHMNKRKKKGRSTKLNKKLRRLGKKIQVHYAEMKKATHDI